MDRLSFTARCTCYAYMVERSFMVAHEAMLVAILQATPESELDAPDSVRRYRQQSLAKVVRLVSRQIGEDLQDPVRA